MYRTIEDFTNQWKSHVADTLTVFGAMTDESLTQAVADDHRTLGRMAWHIVLTMPEMANAVGLDASGPEKDTPPPTNVAAICDAYKSAAESLTAAITKQWTDADLLIEDNLYGLTWKRGFTVHALICHEIHHRGQMTVLMRQAGLKVPGVYGPALEEWASHGAEPPVV